MIKGSDPKTDAQMTEKSQADDAQTGVGENLQQALEEMMNPKTPDVDPRDITRQMLYKCQVLRKRNTNVTPLAQDQSKKSPLAIRSSPRNRAGGNQ